MKDLYKTIRNEGKSVFKDRGSKFSGFAYPVENTDEIKEILLRLKKAYYDANHHCYAWRIGYNGELLRTNDDGEPSGSAGKPILQQIVSRELTNVLVVVVRYFGGILLGTGGLINAYRTAASEALDHSGIIEIFVEEKLEIVFDYVNTNEIMKILNDADANIFSQDFTEKCRFIVAIKKSKVGQLTEKLRFVQNLKILIVR